MTNEILASQFWYLPHYGISVSRYHRAAQTQVGWNENYWFGGDVIRNLKIIKSEAYNLVFVYEAVSLKIWKVCPVPWNAHHGRELDSKVDSLADGRRHSVAAASILKVGGDFVEFIQIWGTCRQEMVNI